MNSLYPVLQKLVTRKVKINVITRMLEKHIGLMKQQAEDTIRQFEILGVQVFVCTNKHHRKLAIIDRDILWEGSLNILSQSNSREIMRRTEGDNHAQAMFDFIKLGKFI